MNVKTILITVLVVTGLLVATFFAGWKAGRREIRPVDPGTVPDTTWFTITEEIPVPSPPDTVYETEYKNVPVPFYIKGDSDTIVDSVLVTLPFERHMAHVDGICDIWHSGFQSKIDSVIGYKQTVTEIIRQPYEVVKMPRLTFDVGAGAMYNAAIGVRGDDYVKAYGLARLNLNMPHTTFSAFGAIDTKGEWGAGLNVTYRLNLIK